MGKDKTILLVDGNNRAWAAFHAYSRLTYKGKLVSMIYGLPSMIRALLVKFKPDDIIICWDGGSGMRKKLANDYKGTRKKKKLYYDAFIEQLSTTRQLLYNLGLKQIIKKDIEADDYIYIMTKKATRKGYKVIIISGDKDFNQLLNGDVSIFHETKKKIITHKNCFDEFGYHPHETVDWLSCVGDKSDNIKGYRGLGPVKMRQLLDKYDSVVSFIENNDSFSNIDKDKLLEILQNNRELTSLSIFYHKYLKGLKPKWYLGDNKPKLNKEMVYKICYKYNMNRLMDKNFIKTFLR